MILHFKRNPWKYITILLLFCFTLNSFAAKKYDEASISDILSQEDKIRDNELDTKNEAQAEAPKTTEKVSVEVKTTEGDTTEAVKVELENEKSEVDIEDEEEKPAEEENQDDFMKMFGSMFGEGGLESLMSGEGNGEANPLKDLMPILKNFGSTFANQMADAEKAEKKDGEAPAQPDFGNLLNMFMDPKNQEKNEENNQEAKPEAENSDVSDEIGEKDETEPAADAIQNENVSDKTKDGSEKNVEENLSNTVSTDGQKTALDLVPYLLRDKLSDVLKTNLKGVTEADMLKINKVYANIENIENFQDIPQNIKKEAPKVYKTSLEMYSQAKEQLVQFFKVLNKEPQNWISGLVKDVKSIGEKHFDALVGMSMESHQNIQEAVSKMSPELGKLLKRLLSSKAAVFWFMNNMLQKELSKMDFKENQETEKDHNDHKEL